MADKLWTVLEIITWASDYFKKNEVDSPRLTIELLLCKVLSFSRLEIYMNYERPLSSLELRTLREMVERRVKLREPLQYIVGETEFYGLPFQLNSHVLIPRPETEILVEKSIRALKYNNGSTVLDIGTGSGCIAISIAKSSAECAVVGIDIAAEAIECAKNNALLNNVTNCEFYQADILKVQPKSRYDVVVSNPPYIEQIEVSNLDQEVQNHEPTHALTDGNDGLTFYRRFASILPQILSPTGTFLFEFGFGQEQQIREIFKQYSIEIIPDYSNIPRIVVGTF